MAPPRFENLPHALYYIYICVYLLDRANARTTLKDVTALRARKIKGIIIAVARDSCSRVCVTVDCCYVGVGGGECDAIIFTTAFTPLGASDSVPLTKEDENIACCCKSTW